MTLQNLKNNLLNTNLFIDNEYLDQYLQLVCDYHTDDTYTEKHHILQRCYYKHNNQVVDNSKNNIVKLAYKDHCKAHWLLYFCTVDYLKQANETSVRYISAMYTKLTKEEKPKFNFVQKDFDLLQSYMNTIVEDTDSRYWSVEDVQFLIDNYGDYGSGSYCAEKLNRSVSQITSKARHLGLGNSFPNWTNEDINILTTYYPGEGDAVHSRLPLHSKAACRAKAHELKIQTQNHY